VITPVDRERFALPTPAAFAIAVGCLTAFFLAAGAPSPLLIVLQQRWSFAPWLLTLAFGIYALTLLGTLVTAGRLSDYIGRRPVLFGALVLEIAAVVLMLAATDITAVIAGRFIQGIATGAATSAFSAAVIELSPARARSFATSMVSALPAAGLGLGALAAGALARFDPAASTVIWAAMATVAAVGAVAVIFFPETGQIRPGARASLRPSLRVPRNVTGAFVRAAPTLTGAWMMAALFMGLVPTTLGTAFGIHNILIDGATCFVEPGAAAVTTLLTARLAPTSALRTASVATVIGALGFLLGLLAGQIWLLDLAGIIGGIGFGTAVGGTIRATIPETAADRRAGVFAAIYTVSYLAFGVPAIISGALISTLGLTPVVAGFASATALIAAVGAFSSAGGIQRRAAVALDAARLDSTDEGRQR
jgi:MFS family permease